MVKVQGLLQKLKEKSRKEGISYQFMLQLVCQEEFLRRLANSKYRENLILKGGLFIFVYTEFSSRPTMDIDFLMKNLSNNQTDMLNVINDIINIETDYPFIEFQIKTIMNITEQKDYHGIRIKMMGAISNTKTPFDIDIGIGDVIVPHAESRKIGVQVGGFESPNILTYSLESTVSEKWDAIISRMETTSRMKDYYDIYYLAGHYDFDGKILKDALLNTLSNRKTFFDENTIIKVSDMYNDTDMQKRWESFSNNSLEIDLEFKTVVDIVVQFIGKPMDAIINKIDFSEDWYSHEKMYK
ncbi:nucleotidyl transferase AbiEii/AbiGii toxin family protein [Acetobacterium fimetarium]|uniref:Nucleotidyl transferase AbiEii/AbiGii toxin family protein n=1 Tax=Acetobacterium fimetarium TaxID=52691 RepID=A0ABR6WS18_9FIRM|nr:nucleotidyl transferase AbiEii/AbiGii toxin family protein [Acetobacterium fimetarium]MBC3803351.1 nucleotidyl transferase AbiEii/AbiGii toxin family protein [Acetobacterium fimetarium]